MQEYTNIELNNDQITLENVDEKHDYNRKLTIESSKDNTSRNQDVLGQKVKYKDLLPIIK